MDDNYTTHALHTQMEKISCQISYDQERMKRYSLVMTFYFYALDFFKSVMTKSAMKRFNCTFQRTRLQIITGNYTGECL